MDSYTFKKYHIIKYIDETRDSIHSIPMKGTDTVLECTVYCSCENKFLRNTRSTRDRHNIMIATHHVGYNIMWWRMAPAIIKRVRIIDSLSYLLE